MSASQSTTLLSSLTTDPHVTIGRRPGVQDAAAGNWMQAEFMTHFRVFFMGPMVKDFVGEAKVHVVSTQGKSLQWTYEAVLEAICEEQETSN